MSHAAFRSQRRVGSIRSSSAAHSLAPRLLVQSEFRACGIRENGKCPGARRDLCSWRQHAAACSLNLLQGVWNVVDHDVYACLLIRSSVALLHPGPADTTRVIKRELAVAALSDRPAKNTAIEVGGCLGGYRGNLKVTDFAVWHGSLRLARVLPAAPNSQPPKQNQTSTGGLAV